MQFRNCGTVFSYQVKAQPNFRNRNFTTQCKYFFFAILDWKRVNNLLNKPETYQNYGGNEAKISLMYRIALLTEKNCESATQLKRNNF